MDEASASISRQFATRLKAAQPWDVIIVGGGIVGAAVLREAVRAGLKAVLLEQRDFAWGTSSRSSKMVHGGLRYIASGDIKITRDSVRERQRLLQQVPGLVEPMRYLFADRKRQYPGRWLFTALLSVYDLFAGKRDHRFLHKQDLLMQAPHWNEEGLTGACQYTDAATDDARLVLRLLQEAVADGGIAFNYCEVERVQQDNSGLVSGVVARDVETGEQYTIAARVVVNATGAWADKMRTSMGAEPRVRPLRGSHMLFAPWQLPVYQSLTFMHPKDKRPVFIFPWEGVTVVGTTDIDHHQDLSQEPSITREEVDYLFTALASQFPNLELTESDVISSYAGIRSVVGTGALNPSREKREHCVWDEHGLITVTGGKLTTFRIIALDVLKALANYLPQVSQDHQEARIFAAGDEPESLRFLLAADQRRRILGRYGAAIIPWLEAQDTDNLGLIPGTQTLWLELGWAAANENVVHLDDLLLRRTRIGLLVQNGAAAHLPRIRRLCQSCLGWNDQHWQREEARYMALWQRCYSMPQASGQG